MLCCVLAAHCHFRNIVKAGIVCIYIYIYVIGDDGRGGGVQTATHSHFLFQEHLVFMGLLSDTYVPYKQMNGTNEGECIKIPFFVLLDNHYHMNPRKAWGRYL